MRDIDKVLNALSAPMRREILALIWTRELPAGEIAAALPVTKPTVSQHLAVLRDAGLVTMTASGTSRRYRARQEALSGLHAALEGAQKWVPAERLPDHGPAVARSALIVIVSTEVDTDQETTFRAFTDGELYSRWLGAPVTIKNGRFAATMEWGTEVRGTYEVVAPPELIAMRWDFDDENVPVPGRESVAYLRVRPSDSGGAVVEIQQLVDSPPQAEFMQVAWGVVLSRLQAGVVAACSPATPMVRRPGRRKQRSSA